MDAAEYKHVVLGLLFLKYISDAFEEEYQRLSQDEWADPEDPDEYLANNIFWVQGGSVVYNPVSNPKSQRLDKSSTMP